MGKNDYLKSKERQIELIVLLAYTLYSSFVLYAGHMLGGSIYMKLTLVVALLYPWILYFGKYMSYKHRATVTTYAYMINLLIYVYKSDNVQDSMISFIGITTLLGLYGIPKLLKTVAVTFLGVLAYWILFENYVIVGNGIDSVINSQQVSSVCITIAVVYYMVKLQKENRESMLEMIEALQHSERVKDDFLANVSHELRTPINSIYGISEIMLNKEIPDQMHEDLLSIRSAGKNLMTVVTDILDFSELQDGEFELMEENYYISSTIYDIISIAVAKKNDKRLQIIVDCDAGIPGVLIGDEQKIRRVIMNVVDNAIKFTNEGCVRIRIGYRKEEYGINLIISVKDTGIGMSEEDRSTIFNEFTQKDMSRKRNKGGVGLGLAISKAIVYKMGGFFTAESEIGKGTEIQFVIPQKVYDEAPIAHVENKDELNVAVYIDMEQFMIPAIRDAYAENISHMIEALDIKCHVCRNLAELKRRQKREDFTHVFISFMEYLEDPQYFDALAKKTSVSLIIDHYDDMKIRNRDLNRVYKPFFVLSFVSVLNRRNKEEGAIYVENVPKTPDNSEIANLHVLVVDDNRMNIRVLEGLLEEYNIKTTYALSGKEALDKIESKDYDLVFMDHMMPGMDGIETFHHIRKKKDEYYQKVPIIALTANAIAGAREMFINEGFDDFVAKPVESSTLSRVIKRHVLLKNVEAPTAETIIEKPKMPEVKTMAEKEEEEKEENGLVIGNLDIKKGIIYCGNEKNYIMILQEHRRTGAENLAHIQELYHTEDWKNYTIAVHGVKSSMMSIGAVLLSELAKELELAGKRDDINYIKEHHEPMMKEYERVVKLLEESPILGEPKSKKKEQKDETGDNQKAAVTKPEITEEDVQTYLRLLEDAAFCLDGAKMLSLIEGLKSYSYKGKDLETVLEKVVNKVQMSDFISAYETVEKDFRKLNEA